MHNNIFVITDANSSAGYDLNLIHVTDSAHSNYPFQMIYNNRISVRSRANISVLYIGGDSESTIGIYNNAIYTNNQTSNPGPTNTTFLLTGEAMPLKIVVANNTFYADVNDANERAIVFCNFNTDLGYRADLVNNIFYVTGTEASPTTNVTMIQDTEPSSIYFMGNNGFSINGLSNIQNNTSLYSGAYIIYYNNITGDIITTGFSSGNFLSFMNFVSLPDFNSVDDDFNPSANWMRATSSPYNMGQMLNTTVSSNGIDYNLSYGFDYDINGVKRPANWGLGAFNFP